MIAVTIFYLSLCAACLWCAAHLHEGDRRHARQIAVALTFACCVSNSTWFTNTWSAWPVLDAAVTWFVAIRFRLRPRAWKLAIVYIGAAQQMTHVAWAAGDKSAGMSYVYTITLNGLFVAQLAYVAFSGSKSVGDWFRDNVASRFGDGRRRGVALLLRRSAVGSTRERGHEQ